MKIVSIATGLIAILLFASCPTWAGDKEPRHTLPVHNWDCNGYWDPSGLINIQKTMPANVCVVSETSIVTYHCDAGGNQVQRKVDFVCIRYTNYKQRFIAVYQIEKPRQKRMTRIVLVAEKNDQTNGWEARNQEWARGENTAVTWMSEQASRHYAANNGDPDQVVTVDGPTQKQTPCTSEQPCSRK